MEYKFDFVTDQLWVEIDAILSNHFIAHQKEYLKIWIGSKLVVDI